MTETSGDCAPGYRRSSRRTERGWRYSTRAPPVLRWNHTGEGLLLRGLREKLTQRFWRLLLQCGMFRKQQVPTVFVPLLFSMFIVLFGGASQSLASTTDPTSGHSPLPPEEMRRLYSPNTFIVFDWDDNIFKLPSLNVLFVKGEFAKSYKPREFLISSTEFSNYRAEFGIEGTPLSRFEIIGDAIDPLNGTFRFSRPGSDGRNYMLEDMQRAVAPTPETLVRKIPEKYKAPFFDLYIERESHPDTRIANRILTGRGQTRAEFREALELLAKVPEVAERGYKPTAPQYLTLVGGLGPAHELKASNLIEQMNEAARSGYDLFAFPDDDVMNIRRAAAALAAVPRPIQVWLVWTREGGPSRLVDLGRLASSGHSAARQGQMSASAPSLTLEELLHESLDSTTNEKGHSKIWTEERNAFMCRALFF